MRVGDEDRQLSMKEIRKIILKDENEIGKWESKVSDYTIDDIDEELLKDFIEKGRKAKRINFPYTNKEEILKKLSLVNKNNELLNAGYILFANEARTLKEILEHCGYKDARSFREKYINPLLKNGKLKMTIPEQPKNRNQKYITTR